MLAPLGLFFCCFLVLLLIPAVMFIITLVFRLACVLCGLPKPSVLTAAGVMLVIRVSTTVSEAVMEAVVGQACRSVGIPQWEARVITIFLGLPADLFISAGLHAALMNIKFGKGIEVWFVQMLLYLAIGLALTVLVLLVVLALG